jgi:type III secretion system (T3SS) SseB-like protein
MTTAEQAARPADLLVIPTLRIEVDERGRPVNAAQPILAKLPDGTVIAEAYTSPGRLVAARGENQPWAAMRPRDLATLLDDEDVDGLVVDLGSPEGYFLTPDGDRLPLPASLPTAPAKTDEEVPGVSVIE